MCRGNGRALAAASCSPADVAADDDVATKDRAGGHVLVDGVGHHGGGHREPADSVGASPFCCLPVCLFFSGILLTDFAHLLEMTFRQL